MTKLALLFMTANLLIAPTAASAMSLDLGMLPQPHISKPDGEVKSAIVLISDADGWNTRNDTLAATLTAKGALVIGIDFPAYAEKLRADPGDCIYTISDIESVTQQVERNLGISPYRQPIIGGIGEGGALALAMTAQTPPATIAATVAVDPLAGIPIEKQFCTPAEKKQQSGRFLYDLTQGPLPDPVTIVLTAGADQNGSTHARTLKQGWPDIALTESPSDAIEALTTSLSALVDAPAVEGDNLGLPLTVLGTKPALDTMALIVSGDGGWRDIDAEIGGELQKNGIPVVGLDSLHYFWTQQTPEQVGRDLARIIAHYRGVFGVKHVLLAGYSFGADILPDAYNRLPDALKLTVPLVSMMAMSGYADYEISVMGIIGGSDSSNGTAVADAISRIDPKKLQCVYGSEEEDDPCPTLASKGIETIRIEGGHHFDGDYTAMAQRLIAALKSRLGQQAVTPR